MDQPQPPKLKIWQRLFRRPPKVVKSKPYQYYRAKDIVAILIGLAICLLSIYQKMEILAIVSLIFAGAVIYKSRAQKVINLGFNIVQRARTAKVAGVEINVEEQAKDYSRLLDRQAEWIRTIVGDLTSEQIALLIAVYKAGRYPAVNKDALRVLREKGLLFHNAPSMGESNEVWLSDIGKEIASNLLKVNDVENPEPEIEAREDGN